MHRNRQCDAPPKPITIRQTATTSPPFPLINLAAQMCMRTTCSECNKPTYKGCGRHVEQVLGDVPMEQRCHCREDQAKKGATGANPTQSTGESIVGKIAMAAIVTGLIYAVRNFLL
ncbi:hypothetical protein H4R33_005018 [Dimargaris cristalligena]|nr:hypothetical protein H4R33_005018 [Dimargaris cristalligena]